MAETDDKVVAQPLVNLDDIHAHTQHELETETNKGGEDETDISTDNTDDTTETDKDKPTTTGGDDKADTEERDDSGDDDDEITEDEDGPVDEPTKTPVAPIAPTPPTATAIDTDITKPGAGKVAIKDSEGNTLYFNNVEEMPDDFEPESYKAFAVGVQKLTDKSADDKQTAEQTRVAEQTAANQKEIDEVNANWDKEIATLAKGGVLPKDEKARETEVGDTFSYIAKQLSAGVVIDSFAEAHKGMLYDRLQEERTAEKAKNAKTTKEKGAKVMSGGGAIPGKGKDNTLPPGVSLDAVHARYSGLTQV